MSEDPRALRLMTVKEVARILRVSHMTVYRLFESGELDGYRVGRSVRIPQESFEEYLRSARG